jgi:hypothetical protein
MPITPTNLAKHTITPVRTSKTGYAMWGDAVVTWGDSGYSWGAPSATLTNLSKHTITPTNQTKH